MVVAIRKESRISRADITCGAAGFVAMIVTIGKEFRVRRGGIAFGAVAVIIAVGEEFWISGGSHVWI